MSLSDRVGDPAHDGRPHSDLWQQDRREEKHGAKAERPESIEQKCPKRIAATSTYQPSSTYLFQTRESLPGAAQQRCKFEGEAQSQPDTTARRTVGTAFRIAKSCNVALLGCSGQVPGLVIRFGTVSLSSFSLFHPVWYIPRAHSNVDTQTRFLRVLL